MKKVSIITLNEYRNYGNRLQLYALSKTVKEMGFVPEIYWPKNCMGLMKYIIKYCSPLIFMLKKERKLKRFTSRNIARQSTKCRQVAIIGSDQVWNPDYFKNEKHLLYGGKSKKKISYAASVGRGEITRMQKNCFSEALSSYSAISVREKSAKELLQPLTDKKIEVVLDPTLLLDKVEYEKLERKPKSLKENEGYILCYILGNREQQSAIEKYAKEHDLKVILFSDKRDSDYGIEEFLYLIHHAKLICTDSFHACVFSFIFERPFVAFKRTGKENYMYTRLQNLIETFELKNREFNGREITDENLSVNYTNSKKILSKERKRSLGFLEKALGKKDEN